MKKWLLTHIAIWNNNIGNLAIIVSIIGVALVLWSVGIAICGFIAIAGIIINVYEKDVADKYINKSISDIRTRANKAYADNVGMTVVKNGSRINRLR